MTLLRFLCFCRCVVRGVADACMQRILQAACSSRRRRSIFSLWKMTQQCAISSLNLVTVLSLRCVGATGTLLLHWNRFLLNCVLSSVTFFALVCLSKQLHWNQITGLNSPRWDFSSKDRGGGERESSLQLKCCWLFRRCIQPFSLWERLTPICDSHNFQWSQQLALESPGFHLFTQKRLKDRHWIFLFWLPEGINSSLFKAFCNLL